MSFSYHKHVVSTFADLTLADLAHMNIPYDGLYARQLGQPQEKVFPTTGSETYQGCVTNAIKHVRVTPDDKFDHIHCTPLAPGTSVTVIKDPKYPTWVFIKVSGGLSGWVGGHHVSSAPARVLAPSPAYVVAHSTSFSAVSLGPITSTYTTPSFQSLQIRCIMPQGSILNVIAVSSCGQWFQLRELNTWISASCFQ